MSRMQAGVKVDSDKKIQAVNLAVLSTLLLSVLKIAVAVLTGSVSVFSEAIHSALDLVSSILTRVAVQVSLKPADEGRPFGYGKLENLSALFEAILLLGAGIYIIYEAVMNLNAGFEIRHVPWAIAVTVFSMVVNLAVYFQNRNVGRLQESIAIETNAYHFLTDFFTSAALLVGLILIRYTQWHFIDPLAAIFISVYIFWVAFAQIRKCIDELSDVALPSEEVTVIQDIIKKQRGLFQDFHDLRTRRVGPRRHIEMHLTVCSELKVKTAHDICDRIETDIGDHFKESHVSIHIEPCDHHAEDCIKQCSRTNQPRTQVNL